MASILRSSKFVRYIAGFARNVVSNTPREFDGNLVNAATVQCYCGAIPRALATQASVDQTLEHRLRSLDQDVRKSGRISRRDIEDVLEEIRTARSATSSQSLLVIRCCGSLVPDELPEVRTKLVQEIWTVLNKINVPMDVSHYNALLRVYLENEYKFSPLEFLKNMELKCIEPNRVTYQRLIQRYCQDGDIDGATKILEFMREKLMPVNENVFNSLIYGHAQCEDMQSAHGILSVMQQAGLEPSADTYTTLLCGYAKFGNIDTIKQVIEECEAKEIWLLDKDYLDIIYSLATNNHGHLIKEILPKIKKHIGYNQDAINLTLRLINKGQVEAAYDILKTVERSKLPNGSLVPIGNFFIRQLVKCHNLETIKKYCQQMELDGLYQRGILLATEVSLELNLNHLAFDLLLELKSQNLEIRQHYFWPLLQANKHNNQEIVAILQKIQSLFGLIPNNETLRDWVLPNLKGKSTELLSLLREANISIGASASSLVTSLLSKGDIKEAALIASSVNKAIYNIESLRRPLSHALLNSNDVASYITLLRRLTQDGSVDQFLIDLAKTNTKKFVEIIPKVLEGLLEEGLSVANTTAQLIEGHLHEKMTEDLSNILSKLTSGELVPKPLTNKVHYTPYHQMNVLQLEKLIENLESKNLDCLGYNRRLLTLYHREGNLEKMKTLLAKLQNIPAFDFGSGIHAILMDTLAQHGHLEEAMEEFNKVKELEKDSFKLDESKCVRLAGLMAKNGQIERAIQFLEESPCDKGERSYSYTSLVWRIFNSMAEEGRQEDLTKFFEALLEKDYLDVNTIILGPLIKVFIVNGDLEGALKKFEWCVDQYKLTPWKNELACKLIEAEDADKLQKLTDLSTVVHGEINSLYDLVFSFVECGRVRQARKILETPGLQNRPQRINNACERFQQEGLVKPLEGLKDATRDLNHIDRSDIYYQLLLSYIKQNDAEKSLGLWTQMQEEDLQPTDQFLLKLGSFLQEKGLQVPFAIPHPKIQKRPPQQVPLSQPEPSKPRITIKQKLASNDLEAGLQLFHKQPQHTSVVEASQLIEKLIHEDRLGDALEVTMKMLNNGSFPVQKIFRFLLNKLAAQGQVDQLKQIGDKLTIDVKRLVSFDNRYCHANIVANRVEEYLTTLEENIDKATKDSLEIISSEFPRGGAYGILEKHPEHTEKFETIAIKYAQKGIVGPLNVLWTKYFIENNQDKITYLWDTYLKHAQRIMFQKIIQTARDTQNEDLIKRLVEHLKISNVTPGAVGNAYSCYLDVLVAKNRLESIETTFNEALSQVSIENINRTAVLRVKECYEKLGKSFDYQVPAKSSQKANEEV
ncbi:unnamed protein product [Ceutorhynchus assimilis]|uniref:Leucine-rich PPR motif-containing protein, mitochondrial n=1 Tax=Ceutorhynchus assimilis TaxID=467358 RepID=A0A9N9MKF6_9CUCU|nr:unnamed protein product [Ceutorhynchus assimilis]